MPNYAFKAYYSSHTKYSKTPKIVNSHVLDSKSVRISSGAQAILRFLVVQLALQNNNDGTTPPPPKACSPES
jgi:hypothetical protein